METKDFVLGFAAGKAHGGGGVIQSLSVTQNGTYNPPSGVDGYAPVTVNVSGGGGSSFPTLPNEYQRVEYISCTEEQYATVQNFSLPTDKFIRIVMESAVSGEKCMFGYNGGESTQFECFTGSNAIADDYGQSLILYWTEYASSYTLVNKKQFAIWKVNNLCEKAFIAMYRDSTASNSYKYNGKIFRITISDSDNLEWYSVGTATFDFIPCYRKSDSVPGFYDVINNVFYPSESGIPFVAGPDAN